MLPILPPLAICIWKRALQFNSRLFLLDNPLSLCAGGLLLWAATVLFFHPPPRIYVFAHELTHALFIKLFRGTVKKISVKQNTGFVISDRTNFLITLAPYIFPFYAFVWSLLLLPLLFLTAWPHTHTIFWTGLGACLGYHWTMTGRLMLTAQSDFSTEGYAFSLTLTAAANLFLLLSLLYLLPSFQGSGQRFSILGHAIWDSYAATLCFIRDLWFNIQHLFATGVK
ncbi:MAG: hypothetical protein PHV34_07870 [Verrucomicrobiae bacterium]|nr:hypothetical protein [Verrucomicrobiae bacterium]